MQNREDVKRERKVQQKSKLEPKLSVVQVIPNQIRWNFH